MLKYHDDNFRRFPRRTSDIDPNEGVVEHYAAPKQRLSWLPYAAAALVILLLTAGGAAT